MKPSIWYDRTIPEAFRRELSPGGRFERLVRFAHGRHLADVQLRDAGGLQGGWTATTDAQHLA